MVIGIDGNEANVKNRVGSGTYAFELLKQFANYSSSHSTSLGINSSRDVTTKNTIKFTVYLKDHPLAYLPKETENFKYKVFGPKKLWTQFALPVKLTFGKKPDVFFSMGHYGPRFSRVPYVVTVHDLSYLHFPEMFIHDDLYQLKNWTRYSIRNAVHIIAVSKTTKNDIVKNYEINPAKITVTYEGYDKNRFKPQSKLVVDRVKEKYKINGNYIIFVGTLQPRKNIERLIEAFSLVIRSSGNQVFGSAKPENPTTRKPDNLKLVICGKKGWLYSSIFQKVKDLDLENRVIFTDYVPDEDLPALMSGAEVYILPSLWEGFGIPVIEAQACGVPVVVSNTSSLPEIVGESGILVDPTDAESITGGIKKALDPKTKADLVKRGFKNTKRFSWEKCAKETLEVLEKAKI